MRKIYFEKSIKSALEIFLFSINQNSPKFFCKQKLIKLKYQDIF
jgi:hypothetical protein